MAQAQAYAQYVQQQQFEQQKQVERQKVGELIPEWRDPAKFQNEYQQLGHWLLQQGLTPEEWQTTIDARLVAIARKAWLYDQSENAKRSLISKRVQSLPKVVRPGSPKELGQADAEKVAALKNRAAKSGSVEDAGALLTALMGGR
jgi:hypothetical protein